MADRLERELHGLDAERPLPNALYLRLEAALLEDAETRGVGADDDAAMFTALDAPRPIPPETRAALERALTHGPRRRDRRSVLLAAAAAVLLVVGAVAALRGSESPPNRQVAVGPGRSVPEAAVPPVLQAPLTTVTPPVVAAPAPAAPTTRRSTTTTTWNCGLCARNGAGQAAAAAPPTSNAEGSPAVVQAARLAPQITTVTPSSGPRRGGTIVTLNGYGFTGASGVLFGSSSAVNFTVVSDTEIRVMAPPSSSAQRVSVLVTYPDGTATPTSDRGPFFTYT